LFAAWGAERPLISVLRQRAKEDKQEGHIGKRAEPVAEDSALLVSSFTCLLHESRNVSTVAGAYPACRFEGEGENPQLTNPYELTVFYLIKLKRHKEGVIRGKCVIS